MQCMLCGCDDDHACYVPEFGPCSWVAPELCSHCEHRAFTYGPWEFVPPAPHERALPYIGIPIELFMDALR